MKVSPLGLAENPRTAPTATEMFGPGVRETPVGPTGGETRVALLPPHDGRRTQPIVRKNSDRTEKNFPINPSTKNETRLFWKTLSVEADSYFGNIGASKNQPNSCHKVRCGKNENAVDDPLWRLIYLNSSASSFLTYLYCVSVRYARRGHSKAQ